MKSPDDIKKGLECCMMSTCEPSCPYDNPVDCGFAVQLLQDALALIQQLQADNAKKDETIQMLQDGNARLMRMIDEECEKTVKLEAERDELIEVIKEWSLFNTFPLPCKVCKNVKEAFCGEKCKWCREYNNFEWRGVQKEE